ncbi:MAG: ribosome-associated translation inhibitor RaiA [Saprospiraceae bacterium]|nr:ribosome-associated translation inhibitor RaiA [Saprospiraceae bacterium]
MKIQTEAVHFSADSQLLTFVEQKISKLEQFFNRISQAQVVLKMSRLGKKIEHIAEIKLHVPNGFIYIKESSKSFEAALNKAVVLLRLQLLRYKMKRFSYGLI